jgi:hypothetical protein
LVEKKEISVLKVCQELGITIFCKRMIEIFILHDFNLTEDDLSNEPKHIFPFHTEILVSLNYCGRSILSNNHFSSGGKHRICLKIIRNHNNVKNILNYFSTKPLKTQEKISKAPMIFICGLSRTGTTLLYNLIACDSSYRAPLFTNLTIQPIS